MMKFNFSMLFPMLLNLSILMILSFPSKMNNFHPISILFILIFLTMMICLKMNFMFKSSISMILFLMMIGGLMIIFMYITSLANNEFFNFKFNYMLINILKILPFLILMIMFFLKFKFLINNLLIESNLNNYFLENNKIMLNLIYMKLNNKSSYYIMLYLYYSMICIMNICLKLKLPLRQLLLYE